MEASHRRMLSLYLCGCMLLYVAAEGSTSNPMDCGDVALANCQCTQTLIQCSNLSQFPKNDKINNYVNIFFDRCTFKHIGGDNIPDYYKAETLVLKNCKIETIGADAFQSLGELRELSIDSNLIKNITKEAFQPLMVLEHLTLTDNFLTTLPEDIFSSLPDLRKVSLNKNQISDLPVSIFNSSTKLAELDLGFNKFTEIPSALMSVKDHLTNLVISGNNMASLLPHMFKDFPYLTYLDVSTLELVTLDVSTFSGLTKLRELRLSNNKLTNIPRDTFSDMRSSLVKIWLDINELKTLENGTVSITTLTDIQLGHNPWHCDKKIVWMKDLHLEKIDHENVTCTTPAALAGQPLANVTRDVLNKQQPIGAGAQRSMIAAAIAIPIIVLCVLAIFCIIVRLVQNKRNQKRAQVRYSAVYRDTVESAPPRGYHRPTSQI